MKPIALSTLSLIVAASVAGAQSIDAFNPVPLGPPTSLTLQADGKVILVGNFLGIGGTPRTRVARLNIDGTLDTTFLDPDVDSEVKTAAVQADGKILIGGGFFTVGGMPRHDLARLNTDGSLDTSFADPALDNAVWSIAVQPDGEILAGGDFEHVGTVAREYLARFTAQGNLDASFADPQFCCLPVRAVALQSDGHVLVGGFFSHVGTASHFYFARFSGSGAFDPAFPALDRDVQAGSIVAAPDGSVYVGDLGNGIVLKLTASGAMANGFNSASADSTIDSLALQPNGKVVIGGIFENVGGQPRHALARLNADGSLDTTFADLHFSLDATHQNGYVEGIAAQADGEIVAIGNFGLADALPRHFVARVATGDPAVSGLSARASGTSAVVTWTRSGDGPELVQTPTLMVSSDGTNFTAVGAMAHITGGWQATIARDLHGTPFFLQARGPTSNGAGNGSRGQVTSRVLFSDTIFADGFD